MESRPSPPVTPGSFLTSKPPNVWSDGVKIGLKTGTVRNHYMVCIMGLSVVALFGSFEIE